MKDSYFGVRTQHMVKSIDWDQIPSGTMLRKFTATDDGGDAKEFRVVLHGLIDLDGNVYITDELVSSDAVVCGRKEDEPRSGGKRE